MKTSGVTETSRRIVLGAVLVLLALTTGALLLTAHSLQQQKLEREFAHTGAAELDRLAAGYQDAHADVHAQLQEISLTSGAKFVRRVLSAGEARDRLTGRTIDEWFEEQAPWARQIMGKHQLMREMRVVSLVDGEHQLFRATRDSDGEISVAAATGQRTAPATPVPEGVLQLQEGEVYSSPVRLDPGPDDGTSAPSARQTIAMTWRDDSGQPVAALIAEIGVPLRLAIGDSLPDGVTAWAADAAGNTVWLPASAANPTAARATPDGVPPSGPLTESPDAHPVRGLPDGIAQAVTTGPDGTRQRMLSRTLATEPQDQANALTLHAAIRIETVRQRAWDGVRTPVWIVGCFFAAMAALLLWLMFRPEPQWHSTPARRLRDFPAPLRAMASLVVVAASL